MKLLNLLIGRLRRHLEFSAVFEKYTAYNAEKHIEPRQMTLGQYGEQLAAVHLINSGYKILHQNWKCKIGELDIIALEKGEIVFVEVKTRTESKLAKKHLLDTIGKTKKRKLQALAQVFIKYHFLEKKVPAHRIDIIGIVIAKDDFLIRELRHLKGVL